MSFATAFIAAVLCAGAHQGLQQTGGVSLISTSDTQSPAQRESRQATSGVVITADVEGRVAIYDSQRRLVVELDKPAGRQLEVALEPGEYEAWLGSHPPTRARFAVGDGVQTLLARAHFQESHAGTGGAPGHAPGGHGESHHAIDSRHRIEVRFGGWGDGWYDEHGGDFRYSGSAQAAFGLEYLNFVRNDLGIGLAITTLAAADGGWQEWDDGGAGRALVSIPVVARWYPARRLTRVRSVEPYVTAGIGPVFAADGVYVHDDLHGWDHDDVSSGHVGTAFGGRIGGGVDFRLGHVFTVGVGGAWNWDTGFHGEQWNGARPGGGEFTVAFGWNFGR